MTSLLTKSPPLEEVEQPAQRETPVAVPGPREKPARLVSLDAYRGAIMLFMASGGLALPEVAKHFPDDPVWRFLAFNTDHVPWIGCSLWDLIQPSFMFMVGVAMPYSIASRRAKGDSEIKITFHVLYRAIFLVLLAIFLSSNWSKRTNFVFTNVLAQIGLGYAFLYLLLGRGVRVQLAALARHSDRLLAVILPVAAAGGRASIITPSAGRTIGRDCRAGSRTGTRTRTRRRLSIPGSSISFHRPNPANRSASTRAAIRRSTSCRRWRR